MARSRVSGIGLLFAEALLVCSSLGILQSCADAKAVSEGAGRIEERHVAEAIQYRRWAAIVGDGAWG
jgi:hypothetical protein